MNAGKIEQFGTPEEIYNDPKNIFVAEFIGNPKMNIIKINLEGHKKSITLDTGNTTRANVKIIAEVGINHNGDMDLCKKLIMASKVSGAQYVKIQKRNPDVCVPEAQKSKIRDTPWGTMTYIDYKRRMEFNEKQIKQLVNYSKSINIEPNNAQPI